MTAPLKLKKEQEVVLKIKKERDIEHATVDIIFVNDVSGSMCGHCRPNGVMRGIMQKAVAAASIMDPNKKVDVIAFDTEVYDLGSFSENDFDSIPQIFENPILNWGGTNYGAAFEFLAKKFNIIKKPSNTTSVIEPETEDGFFAKIVKWFSSLFGFTTAKPAAIPASLQAEMPTAPKTTELKPTLVLFFTDGEDFGSMSLLQKSISALLGTGNIFIMAVGCDKDKRKFDRLIGIADANYGMDFIHVSNINDCSANLYEYLLTPEFVKWLKDKQEVKA